MNQFKEAIVFGVLPVKRVQEKVLDFCIVSHVMVTGYCLQVTCETVTLPKLLFTAYGPRIVT